MRTRTRRFLKLTIGAELRHQLVASVSVRRGPRNDTIDFSPVARKAHSIRPIGVGIGDKGYDSERNHVLLREGGAARHVDDPSTDGARPPMEDGRALQEGDEAEVLGEGVPPEVQGRDNLLCRQEDHGGRDEVSQGEGTEQRDQAQDDSLQRHEGRILLCQRVSTEPFNQGGEIRSFRREAGLQMP
jgi:hypothetical protein